MNFFFYFFFYTFLSFYPRRVQIRELIPIWYFLSFMTTFLQLGVYKYYITTDFKYAQNVVQHIIFA